MLVVAVRDALFSLVARTISFFLFFFSPFFFFSLLPYLLPGGTVGASLVPRVPDVVYPFE